MSSAERRLTASSEPDGIHKRPSATGRGLTMNDETLVEAENVSKKFSRSLKHSLWYGTLDLASALNPFSGEGDGGTEREGRRPSLRSQEFWAVDDISFELKRGDCLGLVGHNGAGKSTLLKLVNGLITPDAGSITTRGKVAALIELDAGFNPILTGRENIYNRGALLGLSRDDIRSRFDRIVEFAEIGDFLDAPVQNYSSGMRVRLGFAVAVQVQPDVLIIDEVLAVGDIAFRFKCLNAIGELMSTAAVIFVSHTMPQIFRICNQILVMDHGSTAFAGKDVSAGVATYQSLFRESPESVTGSGEITVRSLELDTEPSQAETDGCVRLDHGAPLSVSAVLEAVPAIHRARVQFLFWNAEMLPVLEIMADELKGRIIEFTDCMSEIHVTLPHLELNAGKYSISIIAASENYSRIYCRHDNAGYVQVDAGSPSGAHVLTIGDWSNGKVVVRS